MKCRRAVISRTGGPEVFEFVEEDLPEPGPGEARIKVQCAGVAFGDVLRRAGKIPGQPKIPYTPGYDMAGIVDAVGAGVTGLEVGEKVAAYLETGCYAEYVCAPAGLFVHIPEDMDPAVAACIPLNYITAHQMLHRVAKAKKGERLLIHGAAGGLGIAVLQLARVAGLEVYGTASAKKHDLVRKLGATPIDYKKDNFATRILLLTGHGVDIVLDPIGGKNWRRSFECLRAGGRLVAFGISSVFDEGSFSTYMSFMSLMLYKLLPNGKSASFYSIGHSHGSNLETCASDLAALIPMVGAGQIAPVIARQLPLADVAEAHRLIESATVAGKIILECNP